MDGYGFVVRRVRELQKEGERSGRLSSVGRRLSSKLSWSSSVVVVRDRPSFSLFVTR